VDQKRVSVGKPKGCHDEKACAWGTAAYRREGHVGIVEEPGKCKARDLGLEVNIWVPP
jgi:hypothetical protein